MPKKKVAVIAAGVLMGACCLVSLTVAALVFNYRPAVTAAPGHQMRWPTQPDLRGSIVKGYQAALDQGRTCAYSLLGWDGEGTLFYLEDCQDSDARLWSFDPEDSRGPYHVETVAANLVQETVARDSILEMVRSPLVRPREAEPNVRALEVRADGLASPDGRWVAAVVRHIYGPEDVIVLTR